MFQQGLAGDVQSLECLLHVHPRISLTQKSSLLTQQRQAVLLALVFQHQAVCP